MHVGTRKHTKTHTHTVIPTKKTSDTACGAIRLNVVSATNQSALPATELLLYVKAIERGACSQNAGEGILNRLHKKWPTTTSGTGAADAGLPHMVWYGPM